MLLFEVSEGFLGGCLHVAEAGALGACPDASKRHQGPGAPTPGTRKSAGMICPGGLRSAPGVAGLGTS